MKPDSRLVDVEPIREAFKQSGWSIDRLSRATGISRSSLGYIVSTWQKMDYYTTNDGERRQYKVVQRRCNKQLADKIMRMIAVDPVNFAHLDKRDLVELAPLKEAFEKSEFTLNDLAKTIGCDPEQVRRWVGPSSTYKSCSYTNALKIADALGYDPVDFGL